MNYSKDLQRRRRWFRLNYALIVASMFMVVTGLLVDDWHPVPAAKYAEHSTEYLRVQQKLLTQPNVLSNTLWVRGGSQEAAVSLNELETVEGSRTYRLSATLNPGPNVTASLVTSPVAVAANSTYVYEDDYLATVENQVEVEEYNAAQVSVGKQFLSRYPASAASNHYASHFTTGPQTATVIVRRYVDQSGKLTVENQRMRRTSVAGFPAGMVTVAFDDNLAGAYSTGAAELQKHGFKGTYYAVTSTIGQAGYMTKDQIKSLAKDGHEIASHSLAHRDLLGLNATEKDAEIARSREQLFSMGLGEVQNFAAPFGKNDDETKRLARRYYRSQRDLESQAINYPYNFDPYAIKAFVVDSKTDPARVASLIDQAKKTGGWLVLVYHDFGDQNDWTYRIPADKFKAHMQVLADSKVTVKTVNGALDTIDAYFKEQP